jgi:hypothetical protein
MCIRRVGKLAKPRTRGTNLRIFFLTCEYSAAVYWGATGVVFPLFVVRRCDGSAAALTKRTATWGAGVGAAAHADRDRACRRLVATKSITLLKVLRNGEGKAFQPYGIPICGRENVRCVLSSNLTLVISYFSARDSHGMDWGGAVRSSMQYAQCGTRVKGPNAARAQLLSVGPAVALQHRSLKKVFGSNIVCRS